MKLLALLLGSLLTGCAGMQQWANERQQQQEAYRQMLEELTPEQRVQYAYQQQLLAIERQRLGTQQVQAGLAMMQSAQPTLQPHPLAFPLQVNCSSRQVGNTVQTSCY